MRILVRCLLAFGLVGVAQSAEAQTGLRGPGGSIGGFHLIMMPAVQQDLQLDEGQIAKAKQVAGRMNTRFEQDMGKLKGLNEQEKAKRAAALAGPHYEEGMRELRTFLKPPQVERFDQILFQLRGTMAMLEPKIAETMQITNAQAQQVAAIVAQGMTEQRAAAKAKDQAKLKAIDAEANAKAVGLLSPEQKRTWDRLTGEPFVPAGSGDMTGGNPRR